MGVLEPGRCWIQTYTGVAFYPLEPRAQDVAIADIAHALALQCRFSGHVRTFYSVAEHSIRLARAVPPADALWGLLHDAAEAYLIDVPRPIKRHSPVGAPFRAIEGRIMEAICAHFALPVEPPPSIKVADRRLLMTEKRDLLGPEPFAWTHHDAPYEERIQPWSWEIAEQIFLDTFRYAARIS